MFLHETTNSRVASREQVFAVPTPPSTPSYTPIAHGRIVTYLEERIRDTLAAGIAREHYGLARGGAQVFGVLVVEGDDAEKGLCFGFRNGYDKTSRMQFAMGVEVAELSTLLFSATNRHVLRKQTPTVWLDFVTNVKDLLGTSRAYWQHMTTRVEAMKRVPLPFERGLGFIGIMEGRKALRPDQAREARNAWLGETAPRTLWAFYNCVACGLKSGAVVNKLDAYTTVFGFLSSLYPGAMLGRPGAFEVQALLPSGQFETVDRKHANSVVEAELQAAGIDILGGSRVIPPELRKEGAYVL